MDNFLWNFYECILIQHSFFEKKLLLVYPKVKEKLSAFLFSLVVRFSVHCYWSTYLAKRQHFYSCDFIQNKPQVTLKYSAEKFSRSFKPYKFSYVWKKNILTYFFFFALSSSQQRYPLLYNIFTKNRNGLLFNWITSFSYSFTNPKVMFVMDLSICHLISPIIHSIELLCLQWTDSQLFNVSIIGICVLRPFLPSKLYHHDEDLPKLRLTGEDCTLRTPQQIQYVIHSIHQRYTHDFQSLKKSTYAPQ